MMKKANANAKTRRAAPIPPAGMDAQAVEYKQLRMQFPLAPGPARRRTGRGQETGGFGPKIAEKKD
jgi:hypothetical protein